MKKLILGIAGIVVLDLAFIFALIGYDDSTELAAVALPRPVSHQSRLPQLPVSDASPVEEDDTSTQAESVRKSVRSKNNPIKPLARTKRSVVTLTEENSAPKFKDTIIFYHGPDRENRPPDASVPIKVPAVEPVRKKRNVLSRAFSITKKPYDWVKSIASKL